MQGEFTGVATLDNQQNLRNSTDFRSVYKTLLEDWLGGDIDRRAAERVAVLEPRADQGVVTRRRRAARPRSSLLAWRGGCPPRRGEAAGCGKRAACKGKVARGRARACRRAGRSAMPLPGTRRRAPDGRPPPGTAPTARRAGAAAPAAAPAAAAGGPALPAGRARATPTRALGAAASRAARCCRARSSVEFNNRFAEDPHDLWLRRGGTTLRVRPRSSTGEAAHGARSALAAGTWKLWCNIARPRGSRAWSRTSPSPTADPSGAAASLRRPLYVGPAPERTVSA